MPKRRRSPAPNPPYRLRSHSIGWNDMPAEMCRALVAEMDIETRLKVSQCSQSCDKHARYLYQIALTNVNEHYLITMGWEIDKPCKVWIEFHQHTKKQTFIRYRCLKNGKMIVKWEIKEPGSHRDVSLKYFNRYTNRNKNTIQSIYICDDVDDFIRDNFVELTKFKKLDDFHLELEGCQKAVQCDFLDFEKMKHLQSLISIHTTLKIDEIQKFPGKSITISTSDVITPQNIFDYLNNLKFQEKLREIDIRFVNPSNIDIEQICEKLEGFDFEKDESVTYETSWKFCFSSNLRDDGCFSVVYRDSRIEINWQ